MEVMPSVVHFVFCLHSVCNGLSIREVMIYELNWIHNCGPSFCNSIAKSVLQRNLIIVLFHSHSLYSLYFVLRPVAQLQCALLNFVWEHVSCIVLLNFGFYACKCNLETNVLYSFFNVIMTFLCSCHISLNYIIYCMWSPAEGIWTNLLQTVEPISICFVQRLFWNFGSIQMLSGLRVDSHMNVSHHEGDLYTMVVLLIRIFILNAIWRSKAWRVFVLKVNCYSTVDSHYLSEKCKIRALYSFICSHLNYRLLKWCLWKPYMSSSSSASLSLTASCGALA